MTITAARRLADLESRIPLNAEPPGEELWRQYFPEDRVWGVDKYGTGKEPVPVEGLLGQLTRAIALTDPVWAERFRTEGHPARWPEYLLALGDPKYQTGIVRPWNALTLREKHAYHRAQDLYRLWQNIGHEAFLEYAEPGHPPLTEAEYDAVEASYRAWRHRIMGTSGDPPPKDWDSKCRIVGGE